MKDFAEDYYFVASLLFANGQPYFRAQHEGPNGTALSDVLDVQGNVVVAGLPLCYSYYTSSQNALPEGVFVAQKGFYYGWMDLNGQWIYCQNIFSTATDRGRHELLLLRSEVFSMKQAKISRRSFLLGLGVLSSAALLTACSQSNSASSAASSQPAASSRPALPSPPSRSCPWRNFPAPTAAPPASR